MRSTWGQPDGDDAIAMVMAFRASHGHFALVYWGGNYGGALVTWIEAPLVAALGMKLWLFQAIDTALVLVAVLLLRSIGKRFLPPVSADVAAGTFWFFPALWLFWSSRDYLFYVPSIVGALATCWSVLRWFESRDRRWLWASGLAGGVSIWLYPLVLPLIGPPLALLAWDRRRDRPGLLRIIGAGLLGVSPWLAYFALHGRAALHAQTVTGSRFARLEHTVTQVLPTTLIGGTRRFGVIWALHDASLAHLKLLGVAIYAVMLVYTAIAVRRRDGLRASCGVAVLVWPLVLVAGHVPISPDTYRYGVIPIAPLLLVAADLLSKVRLAPVLAAGALVLVISTISADTSGFAAAPSCYQPLVATGRFLVSRQRTAVWASYWLSAPLELCSGEKVRASSIALPRDHEAEVAAASAPRSTFVVFEGETLDRQLTAWTRQHHARFVRTTSTGYAVWELSTSVTPTRIGLTGGF